MPARRPQSADLFGKRPAKTPPRLDPLEEADQIAIFQWRRLMVPKYPELRWLHASLNGVPLSPGLAAKMRALGMTAGIADVFLPVARGGYSGLYIELKRAKGVLSDLSSAQKEFVEFVSAQGFRAEWCKGWEAAVRLITDYLEARPCQA